MEKTEHLRKALLALGVVQRLRIGDECEHRSQDQRSRHDAYLRIGLAHLDRALSGLELPEVNNECEQLQSNPAFSLGNSPADPGGLGEVASRLAGDDFEQPERIGGAA